MFNNNWLRVEFTQSARRHRIGRGRVLQVLSDPIAVVTIETDEVPSTRYLVVGEDMTGRALEVIAVREGLVLVVIHAMDLRAKYRHLYEEGLS